MKENRAIPPGLTPAQLIVILNQRFREIDDNWRRVVENPVRGKLDLSHERITGMGDPKDDLDGVNLRTLRRFGGGARQEEQQQAAEEVAAGAYTAVFTKDGLVGDGELSPWFTVNQLREGDPVVVSLSASIAPTINPLQVNFRVYPPGGAAVYDLLSEDLALDPGETGPAFTTEFTTSARLAVGAYVEMRIVQAGSAEKVAGEIVLRRPAA